MNIDEKYYFDNLAFKSIQDKNQVILFSDKYKRWFRLNIIGKQILWGEGIWALFNCNAI